MTTPEDVERAKREAVRGDVVTVRWVCKRVVGRFKGVARSLEVTCGRTFDVLHAASDFNARDARARCPSCGGMLTQRADGCEVVSDPQSMMQAK